MSRIASRTRSGRTSAPVKRLNSEHRWPASGPARIRLLWSLLAAFAARRLLNHITPKRAQPFERENSLLRRGKTMLARGWL